VSARLARPEERLGYLVTIIIVVVAGSVLVAVAYVRHEIRPTPLPARVFGRRRATRVMPGDECACGGTIGRSGRVSKRFGELLGCTACKRLWTMDGRRVIRRRRPSYAAPGTPGTPEGPGARSDD
jgi:hypothetical protein